MSPDATPPRDGSLEAGGHNNGSAAKQFSDRLRDEVAPRLAAIGDLLGYGLLAEADIDLAAGGALALADKAAKHLEIEIAERALRREVG
jgi:hypothetical protein